MGMLGGVEGLEASLSCSCRTAGSACPQEGYSGAEEIPAIRRWVPLPTCPGAVMSACVCGAMYALVPPAVVYHHGLHAAGGHYTSDVRLAQSGGWFNANDNHLKPLSEEQVLRGQCKELNKVAYLLCYRRSTE